MLDGMKIIFFFPFSVLIWLSSLRFSLVLLDFRHFDSLASNFFELPIFLSFCGFATCDLLHFRDNTFGSASRLKSRLEFYKFILPWWTWLSFLFCSSLIWLSSHFVHQLRLSSIVVRIWDTKKRWLKVDHVRCKNECWGWSELTGLISCCQVE